LGFYNQYTRGLLALSIGVNKKTGEREKEGFIPVDSPLLAYDDRLKTASPEPTFWPQWPLGKK